MRSQLLEVLFPRSCLGCGFLGLYICPRCEAAMKRVKKNQCFYCKKPSLFGLTHPGCKKKNGIDGYFALYHYHGLFTKIIQEAKYHHAFLVLKELLSFQQRQPPSTVSRWMSFFSPTIISVPLHPQREKERGFNQSDIICKQYFPQGEDIPLLKRVINTPHLANLANGEARKKHIHKAFVCTQTTPPPAVLLVDDVSTSGATFSECGCTLKKAGVQVVLAFSLAQG